MKFINLGKSIKIRIGNLNNCIWKTVNSGEVIELKKSLGLKLGFEKVTNSDQELPKVTEGQIGDRKVETKQIDVVDDIVDYTPDDDFFKELKLINGIGSKTAEDIVTWGTREKLIETINHDEKLPFRDDVVKLLEDKYGKRS